MKRTLILLMAMLILAGCSPSADESASPESDQEVPSGALEDNPAAEVELTGNVFLDAEQKDQASGGGGITRTIRLNKSDALAATTEEYTEFLEQELSLAEKMGFELFGMIFEDGTGVTYFGCSPSNAVYGEISDRGYPVSNDGFGKGMIVPNDDGTYSYREFEDE